MRPPDAHAPPVSLSVAARVPGPALSEVVDFLVPGLEGLHFVAYGSSQGTVVVACARQLDHIGSAACQEHVEQQQLKTLLVLDLRPPAAAAALTFSAAHGSGGAVAAPAPAPDAPLDGAVLHVAFGGGPHLLLAACTRDTLAVVSLEGLAAHLFQQQTSGGGAAPPAQHPLSHQLAAVHCGHADLLAISWTQQLDGILASSADGTLTMWHLKPLAPPCVPEQQPLASPGAASGPPGAALRAAWSVQAPIPQRLVCAGVSVFAPSATAAGRPTGGAASAGSPARSAAGSPAKGGADPSRDSGGAEGERYASVWWPQAREQRQRHYAGGMPSVGQEKLRHPTPVVGLQWSPGVLQKDALALTSTSGGGAGGPGMASPGGSAAADTGSPSSLAAATAATEAEDHPALMTLSEDGTIRVWVETLVLTESGMPPGQGAGEGASGQTPPRGPPPPPHGATPPRGRSPGRSPGSGSPGAAPSSPRDVRAAAAAAAALGAAAPDITSYFCMALVIDPATTAAAAAAQPGGAPGAPQRQPPHVALWARHAGALLLHKQQRRVAPPVLWLFTATVHSQPGGSGCRLLLHLHAVRGLAAIVMSAGYGGSLSSTSGGSSSTRPAAVLWGQHSWELPAAAAGIDPAQLLHRLCCWVSDEEGYPLLHAFTSSCFGDVPGSAGRGHLVLAGRTFSTVQEDGPNHTQVHKQLAVASSWQATAVAHEQPITAFAASSPLGSSSGSIGLLASCDGSGRLLLWDGPHIRHLATVPAAAVGSTTALAWLPLAATLPAASTAGGARHEQWLAVGSGSMLQCYSVGSRQPVAVATAAVPAGCSVIKSLHAFGSSSGSSGGGDISCVLLAVCNSSTGRGTVLCTWHCTATATNGSSSTSVGVQLGLAGTCVPPGAVAVTAAATTGSGQLLVGASDGTVQLLSVAAAGGTMQAQAAASVQEDGPVAAVAADEGCLHLASSSGSSVSIWTAVPGQGDTSSDSSSSSPRCHYVRAASVPLPAAGEQVSALAWLCHSVAPCLAAATSSGSLLLLSAVRDGPCGASAWRWVARLPPAAGLSAGIRHLAAGSGCGTVVAAVGDQLLRLSETLLLPGSDQEGGGMQLLGRLLLDMAGPLPQYHPRYLAALLLSGKRGMAATVLQRLTAWLAALRQHAESAGAATAALPPSPLSRSAARAAGADELPLPAYSGLSLAELVDAELVQIQQLLQRREQHFRSAAAPAARQAAPSQQQRQQSTPAPSSTGMLDLAAFGMAPAAAEEPAPLQQQPAASSLDTGMLDLAAFGMAPAAAEEPAPLQQQPAASSLDTGMLDLAAFGMAPAAAEEPAPLQQQPAPSSLDTGMLDLAAFGMAPAEEPAPLQQQPAASSLDTGMLDLAAFGMAPAAAAAEPAPQQQQQQQPPQQQQASSGARNGSRQHAQPLQPPQQPMVPAQQLLPVPAGCVQQLQELLLAPPAEGGDGDLFSGGVGAWGPAQPALATPIPGLSREETAAVLAIAVAFAQPAAQGAHAHSSAPVDRAAAQFITDVSLACADSSAEEQPGGSGRGAAAALQQQQQQRVVVKNAAGVAYTLAPSAVVRPADSGSGESSGSVAHAWGLLPGLDASTLLWALMSASEEQLLQQALRRLQQANVARSNAAAAAAASAGADAFLAVQAASKADAAVDQPPTWEQLRRLGAGFWLRDPGLLAATAEQLAKQQFAARRSADDCALLYCALGKRSVLQGLYRSTQNRKLSEFLSRDFAQEQHRQAAQKNAFVLLGQHRHEMAAAFFILGGCPHEAVGVTANEMRDPQLALLLCRLLFGGAGGEAELGLLRKLQRAAEDSPAVDAAAAAAACCWLRGEAAAVVAALLGGEQPRLAAAAAAEHVTQLLPLLHLLLTAAHPADDSQASTWRQQLQRCLWALAAALGRCGLHALAVQAATAAQLGGGGSSAGSAQQREALLQQHLLAQALLPSVLEQQELQQRHADASAGHQLELLQQQGVSVDAPAVLTRLRRMRRGVVPAGEAASHPHHGWAPPSSMLSRQHSGVGSVASSLRSRESEQQRWAPQQRTGRAVVGDGQVLFRVDNDKLEAVGCCPLMSPDVLGRPVVVASHRMGLVEGQLHVMPPEPLSPLQEMPDSPEAAAAALQEEEQNQRGGVFSRLLSQLFDQSTWQQDPTWHHGTAEFDVVGGTDVQLTFSSPHGTVLASNVTTTSVAAHPSKQLFLTGCSSGLLHLWQFGEQRALATYTPVPGSELASIARTFSGLLSFSRSFKTSSAAPRLANWGKAAAVRFAPNGERFAAVGEGGVVATWRLDAPTRQADDDGHGCAEWWHQALSKQGCAVDFVGGSSSVLVVGGRSLPTSAGAGGGASNLSVWDTMAPTASSCVGRLVNHQCTVTAVSVLPGGWLLAAGDGEGSLSCTDLRMMGGSSGPRLLWSVKAARGAVTSIAVVPSSASPGAGLQFGGGSSALLATAGVDGAVRVWRGADGQLLQSIEAAHYSTGRPGSRRSSHDGGAQPMPAPGTHAVPATGLAACEEGLVSCGADGCVRLHAFL